MKLEFKILRINEEKGCCALIYKKEKYFLESMKPETDNEFLVWTENGKRLCPFTAYPSKDYISYYEYFHSQEFKEEFISYMLDDVCGTEVCSVRGCDGEYILIADEYCIKELMQAVYYKNGMYHYLRTDITGDLIEHKTFDNEVSLWGYIDAGSRYLCKSQKYRPRQRNSTFWKEKMQQMSSKRVKHSESVLKKVEVKKEVKKGTDTIWLAVLEGSDTASKYEFICIGCEKKINLRTGIGRHGNLGGFRCPFCGRKYFAQNNDNDPQTPVYIYDIHDMPVNYFDSSHQPLFELEMLDK